MHYAHKVQSLSRTAHWKLRFADGKEAQHASVVLANGHHITQFTQTASLAVYPVGGGEPYPDRAPTEQTASGAVLRRLPDAAKSLNGHHCIGASYHRGETDMQYSEADQQQNRQRTVDCFPDASWAKEVDVSEGQARCGVRCATRDHLPMAGNVPDYDATLEVYQDLADSKETAVSAPVHPELFMLGGLGSRDCAPRRCWLKR